MASISRINTVMNQATIIMHSGCRRCRQFVLRTPARYVIPAWVRTAEEADEIRSKTFNARAESIDSKPSFSSSFKSKRCIIPVKGFYEWQHVGTKKIPWYIYCLNDEIFSIAGLYSEWVGTASSETISTFSIITTDANELMAEVHNSKKRMPAILGREDETKWIDLSISQAEASGLLRPYPSELLKAHTISPLVNSRTENRNTPEVIKPYSYKSDNLLF
jgi:putative SOS response-associated peptidase YedK